MAKVKKTGMYQAGGAVARKAPPWRQDLQRIPSDLGPTAVMDPSDPSKGELQIAPSDLGETSRAIPPTGEMPRRPSWDQSFQIGGSVGGLGVDPSARPPSTDRRRALATVHDVIHHGHYLFGLTGPGTRHPSRSPLHRRKALAYQYGGDIPEDVQDPVAGPQPPPPPPAVVPPPAQVPTPPAESNPWLETGYAGQPDAPAPTLEQLKERARNVNPRTRATGSLESIADEPLSKVVPGEYEGRPSEGAVSAGQPTQERPSGGGFFNLLGWAGGAGGDKELLKTRDESLKMNNPNADAADLIAHITRQDTGPGGQRVLGDAANTPEGLARGVSGYQALKDLEMKTRKSAQAALQQDHLDNAAELFNKAQNMVPDSFKTTAKVLPDNRFQITREDRLNGPDPQTGQYPTTTHILNKHQMYAFMHGRLSEIDHQTLNRDQINDNLRKLAAMDVPNMPGQPYGAAGARPYEISRGRYVIGKPEEFTPEQLRGAAVREQFRGLPTLNPYSPASMQREKEISGAIFPQKQRAAIEPDHETALLQHYDRIRKQAASAEGGPPPSDELTAAVNAIYARHAPGGAAARPAAAPAAAAPAAAAPAGAGLTPLVNQRRPHQGGGDAVEDIWDGSKWVPLKKAP
jgi:hypothetical protein